MPLTYRPDIDGLRTIAVFSVVLYHLGTPGFGGGFVGVDIFFVISGYLITALLEKEHGKGGISFTRFYARRARRLLPAAFVVLAFCMGVGSLLYAAHQFDELGLSVAAATVFAANFHFADRTDYFDAPAHDHPLLHTWSLSVEEQFYLLWPLLLILILRGRHIQLVRLGGPLLLLFASLLTSILFSASKPEFAFFHLPTRFWELMLGALIALYRHDIKLSPAIAQLGGLVGLALLAVGIAFISDAHAFPGWVALVPCVGAGLIILCGLHHPTVTARLLSLKPMVWGGLISYSLYLWHWPLIVFWRHIMNAQNLDVFAGSMILGASVMAATLSYRLVEQPVRRLSAIALPSAKALLFAGGGIFIIGGMALTIHLNDGMAWRLSPAVQAAEQQALQRHFWHTRCHGAAQALKKDDKCAFGDTDKKGPFTFALIGDSHGDHYAPLAAKLAKARNEKGRQATANACPALFEVEKVGRGGDAYCKEYRAALAEFLERHKDLKTVAIAGRWAIYSQPGSISGNTTKPTFLKKPNGPAPTREISRALLSASLTDLVTQLRARDIEVILLGQVPPQPLNPNICMIIKLRYGAPYDECGGLSNNARQHLAYTDTLLETLAMQDGVTAILPSRALCQKARCLVALGGTPLYVDDTHLSGPGAEALYNFLFHGS